MSRELSSLINYTGQERQIRQLAISDKIASIEEIACMPVEEICSLVQEHYEIVFSSGQNIYLTKKENFEDLKSMLVNISR